MIFATSDNVTRATAELLRRRRDPPGTAYYLDASDKGTNLLGEEC